MKSDRLFGVVIILGALAYAAGALQIQTSFMSDPVGSKTFPLLLSAVAAICGAAMITKPDDDPDWPGIATFGSLAISVIVMVAYAYTIKPLGFMIPTAVCAAILSYQISPRVFSAAATGIGLSVGLFLIFKFALGLGLQPFPKGWF